MNDSLLIFKKVVKSCITKAEGPAAEALAIKYTRIYTKNLQEYILTIHKIYTKCIQNIQNVDKENKQQTIMQKSEPGIRKLEHQNLNQKRLQNSVRILKRCFPEYDF